MIVAKLIMCYESSISLKWWAAKEVRLDAEGMELSNDQIAELAHEQNVFPAWQLDNLAHTFCISWAWMP